MFEAFLKIFAMTTIFKYLGYTKIKLPSKGQQKCADILGKIFPGYVFKTCRPNFLRNPKSGRNLELDLYCEKLNLAIEYNGQQHYKHTELFHRRYLDFTKQQDRDKLKKQLCQKHGVKLIVVPYWEKDVEKFLKTKLQTKINKNQCTIV